MRIENFSIDLVRMQGERLDGTPSENEVLDIQVSHRVEISRIKEHKFAKFTIKTLVRPIPACFFQVEIIQEMGFEFAENISFQEVKESTYELCEPSAHQISLLTANITRELISVPIMIPPELNREDFTICNVRTIN